MKELSIEEKAKRYDEAFEIARLVLQERVNEPDGASILSELFPELKESKESEDEKIRKFLIGYFDKLVDENSEWGLTQETRSKVLAWLEEQGEQNPAWSEEDENEYNHILKLLKLIAEEQETKGYNNLISSTNWFKSLKDRYTWKPSEEQMKAVKLARSFVVDDFDEHPTLSEILIELEEQLKKLKS